MNRSEHSVTACAFGSSSMGVNTPEICWKARKEGLQLWRAYVMGSLIIADADSSPPSFTWQSLSQWSISAQKLSFGGTLLASALPVTAYLADTFETYDTEVMLPKSCVHRTFCFLPDPLRFRSRDLPASHRMICLFIRFLLGKAKALSGT